ncbi:hypothetical protein GCM10025864_03740 [Luteimicrobium album]|uniref:Uncharacterized protein n=1 Tax=Luteimicrobium album TaxID=1054550 RepID=A0ABQ6HVV3_9MICO|nr:hypothetical protein GCM10025864_03740 [Luteimicrobium album]
MQRDHGLPGAGPAVDDERPAARARMTASWSEASVPSTSRMRADRAPPRLATKADWSSSEAVLSGPRTPSSPCVAKTSSQ